MSAMAAGTGTEPGTLDAATGHVEDIKLASLKDDAGQFRVIKVRERVDPDVVAEYAEKMRAGRTFEPIVVFEDDDGIRWIAEGSHRCPAAEKAGKMHICGYRRRGSHRDAILYAVGTNSTHGKQRTRGDKREAVKRLLEDAEWAQWTDGVIAEACDVSASTVANIRKELASLSSQNGTMDGGALHHPKLG